MGRPPFLPGIISSDESTADECQCPEWGDLHFYDIRPNTNMRATRVCQCPERGDLHFYGTPTAVVRTAEVLCQCPERGDLHFYDDNPTATIQEEVVSMP